MHKIAMNTALLQRATLSWNIQKALNTPNKESWNLFNHPTIIETSNFLRVDNIVTTPYLTDVGLNIY